MKHKMTVAYIAHPIGGDVDRNLKKIVSICRVINLQEPEVVPFAPYFLDCHALDDKVALERQRGIRNDIELMTRGFIDEVRLYGDKISSGMASEIELASRLHIKIKPMSDKLSAEFRKCWPHLL